MGIRPEVNDTVEAYGTQRMYKRGSSIRRRPRGRQYIGPRTGEKYDIITHTGTGEPMYVRPNNTVRTNYKI